jgi:hypothetical protein
MIDENNKEEGAGGNYGDDRKLMKINEGGVRKIEKDGKK